MVRGSGSGPPSGGPPRWVGVSWQRGWRCGAVWAGGWADRRRSMGRNRHGPGRGAGPTLRPMPPTAPSHVDHHPTSPRGGTFVGAALVAAGLTLAVLTVQTPFVARAMPGGGSGSSSPSAALLVWALAIAAGGSLLVSGAGRLAVAVAGVRSRRGRDSALTGVLAALPDDVTVIDGAPSREGRPASRLVVGSFGVAVVHEMAPLSVVRPVGSSWEIRTSNGWAPTEPPLDRAARHADRVRHELSEGDLDFIARVHAAIVIVDATIPRSPACAVITREQVPAWIAALPRQRSLTERRLARLVALVRTAAAEDARRDW